MADLLEKKAEDVKDPVEARLKIPKFSRKKLRIKTSIPK